MPKSMDGGRPMTDSTNILLVDRPAALERVGGDEGLLREIAGLFIEEYPEILEAIERAAGAGDARALERAAHNLKGSASNFGAQPVTDAALRLERMGRAGNLSGAAGAVGELREWMRKLDAELRELSGR